MADSSKRKRNPAGVDAIPQHEADAQLLRKEAARQRELRLAHEAANAGAGSFAVAGGQKSNQKKAARRVRKLRRCRIGWRRSKMKDDAVSGPRDREWHESRPRERSCLIQLRAAPDRRYLEPSALPLHPWSKQHDSSAPSDQAARRLSAEDLPVRRSATRSKVTFCPLSMANS